MDWISENDKGLYGTEAFALDPTDPKRIYVLAGTGYFSKGRTAVLRSEDYGNTWDTSYVEMLAHGNGMGRQTGEKLVVDPNMPNILFCGSRTKGLYKSTDYGKTWTSAYEVALSSATESALNNVNGISFVMFDESQGKNADGSTKTIYLGISETKDNLQVSHDGGATWEAIKGVPTVVHVLRTRRFRGVYSQGYVAKPQDVLPDTVPERAYEVMFERKARLDGICGVCEYHPDENSLASGFIGKYDPFVAPRTDAERAENVDAETFDLMRHADYFASVKVDGTSTTIVFDKRTGAFEAYSHNNHYDLSTGLGLTTKTVADQQGLTKWCEEHPGISLGCELCGPKIQSDRLGLGKHRLFVFSVWDMDGRRYLNPYDYPELVPNCVPLLEDFTLELDFAEELEDLGCCCCWLLEDFTLELDFGC
jgi:hypothetical protein